MTTFSPNSAYAPTHDYRAMPAVALPVATKLTFGDKYMTFLGFVLLGYAVGGKGFAYWGAKPIFVGEIALAIGLLFLSLRLKVLQRLLTLNAFVPLMIFMAWGVCCTVPYIDQYGFDSLRDSVIYMYGLFALVVAGIFIDKPARLNRVIPWFRWLATIYLCVTPFHLAIEKTGIQLPPFPGSDYPFVSVKGGDIAVHLVGAFICIAAFGGINPFLVYFIVPGCAGMCMIGRAALVTLLGGWTVFLTLRPRTPRAWRMLGMMMLGLVVLWAGEIKLGDKGETRTVSAQYLFTALDSVFTSGGKNAALDGTKEWRLSWWKEIRRYTWGDEHGAGKYFWTGKGFGVNLSQDDGFIVDEGGLRSPHNGHMSVLARMGVPGMTIWIILHGVWIVLMLRTFLKARKNKDWKWQALVASTMGYFAAFMINASFDVFIEGPMGGVWLWTLHGFGIALCYIYKRDPGVIYQNDLKAFESDATPVVMPPHRLQPMATPAIR